MNWISKIRRRVRYNWLFFQDLFLKMCFAPLVNIWQMLFYAKESPCLFSLVAMVQPQLFLGHLSIGLPDPSIATTQVSLWSCLDVLCPSVRLDIATCRKIPILLNSERALEVIISKAHVVAIYHLGILFNDTLSSWLSWIVNWRSV